MQRKPRSLTFTDKRSKRGRVFRPSSNSPDLPPSATKWAHYSPDRRTPPPSAFLLTSNSLVSFPRGPRPPPSCDLEGHTAPFAEEAVEPVPGGADVPREPRVKQSHTPSGASSAGQTSVFLFMPLFGGMIRHD